MEIDTKENQKQNHLEKIAAAQIVADCVHFFIQTIRIFLWAALKAQPAVHIRKRTKRSSVHQPVARI